MAVQDIASLEGLSMMMMMGWLSQDAQNKRMFKVAGLDRCDRVPASMSSSRSSAKSLLRVKERVPSLSVDES